jgi:predicted metal-dependent peptidase
METPAEKVSIARTRLVLSEPFFASLVLPMQMVEDYTCKSLCTNGKVIRYNPTYIDNISIEECVGGLAHEGLHIGMCHHVRGIGKEHKLWNRACDYAINPILKKSHFRLPDNVLIKDDFEGKYAEDIYHILYEEEKETQGNQGDNGQGDSNGNQSPSGQPQSQQGDNENGQQQGQQPGPEDWGGVEQNEFSETGETNEEAEANAKQRMVQAVNAAKMAGKGSAELERIVEDLIATKTPWAEILQRFVAEISNNDYTWRMPNKRYVASGLYLPTLYNEEMGKIVFVIDTSSSVDKETLKIFVSELKEAASLFKFPVTVIHVDTKVKHVEELDDDSEIVPVGGGGTEFSPAFKYVEENDIECKALVYLTDGKCSDFPKDPDYNTLWCIYGGYDIKAPFGEVINIA